MKIKIYIALILGITGICALYGCTSSSKKSTLGAEAEANYQKLHFEYTTNKDGTYTCDNNIFKYKREVTGIDGESQVTFVILTNNENTSFEDVSYSMKKSEHTTGVPEFMILGWSF